MDRHTRLPPLNAIRAFAVVAETRSLQKAAAQLGVSPQAVGQQIKLLEEWLNVALFERNRRSHDLTEAGIVLSHFAKAGLQDIADGVRRVSRGADRARIHLNASPFFATRHLLPALVHLRETMPNAEIHLTTVIDLPDFAKDGVDLAVQWGYGGWAGLETRLLIPDPKVICCTPAMAADVRTPADLASATLLDVSKSFRFWPNIFRHLGLRKTPKTSAMAFDDAATMRQAAVAGLGVGLLSQLDADEDIAAGRLVAPLGCDALQAMPRSEIPGFYLIAPRTALRLAPVAALHRWLKAQDWQAQSKRERDPAGS